MQCAVRHHRGRRHLAMIVNVGGSVVRTGASWWIEVMGCSVCVPQHCMGRAWAARHKWRQKNVRALARHADSLAGIVDRERKGDGVARQWAQRNDSPARGPFGGKKEVSLKGRQ